MRRFVISATLALVPFLASAELAAQEGAPVADSLAHPIVRPDGTRIDPPAFVRALTDSTELSAADVATLRRAEAELRRANAPLGARWHADELQADDRAQILAALRTNYRAWWETVKEVLGPEAVDDLVRCNPADTADTGSGAGEVRCLGRSVLALLGLR